MSPLLHCQGRCLICVLSLGPAGGRYLNDVWQLDLDTLAWSNLQVSGKDLPASQQALSASSPQQPPPAPRSGAGTEVELATAALPPSAGHVLVAWGSNLLSVGGHTKAGTYSQLRKAGTHRALCAGSSCKAACSSRHECITHECTLVCVALLATVQAEGWQGLRLFRLPHSA